LWRNRETAFARGVFTGEAGVGKIVRRRKPDPGYKRQVARLIVGAGISPKKIAQGAIKCRTIAIGKWNVFPQENTFAAEGDISHKTTRKKEETCFERRCLREKNQADSLAKTNSQGKAWAIREALVARGRGTCTPTPVPGKGKNALRRGDARRPGKKGSESQIVEVRGKRGPLPSKSPREEGAAINVIASGGKKALRRSASSAKEGGGGAWSIDGNYQGGKKKKTLADEPLSLFVEKNREGRLFFRMVNRGGTSIVSPKKKSFV